VEPNTVVTLGGWLRHVVTSPVAIGSTGLGGGGWVLSWGALMFGQASYLACLPLSPHAQRVPGTEHRGHLGLSVGAGGDIDWSAPVR